MGWRLFLPGIQALDRNQIACQVSNCSSDTTPSCKLSGHSQFSYSYGLHESVWCAAVSQRHTPS